MKICILYSDLYSAVAQTCSWYLISIDLLIKNTPIAGYVILRTVYVNLNGLTYESNQKERSH